jgi:hypothetical protein
MFHGALEESLEMLMLAIEGLDEQAIHWRPVEGANSLAVIVKHTLANAERNVMNSFLGEPYDYDRPEEFRDTESMGEVMDAWAGLRERMAKGLETAPAERLSELCSHARLGMVPGRAVLLQVCRHAAEHVGEARLTRQLLDAR